MNGQHSSEHDKEYLRMVQSMTSSPERWKEAIVKSFTQMRDVKETQTHGFGPMFSEPRSFWAALMQERDEIIRTVFGGEQQFQQHPHKRELEIMILVKLGELSFMRQQAELAVRFEQVLGELRPEKKIEILRKQLRSAGIEPAV